MFFGLGEHLAERRRALRGEEIVEVVHARLGAVELHPLEAHVWDVSERLFDLLGDALVDEVQDLGF